MTSVKRTILLVPVLAALALLLGGCSIKAVVPSVKAVLPSTNLVSSTPTPVPTLPPAPPVDRSSTGAFDNAAGNCVDAASQAIKLIADTAAGRFAGTGFNMDMHLALEPHAPTSGCDDPPPRVKSYRQYVSSAQLTVWALDSVWVNAGSAAKQLWLADVLNALLALYPRAAVSVQVLYNGAPCGSASMGSGNAGSRQFNPTCS
jgi:hypothetical protein